MATARAGNVIGGGDWGEDRLLADAVRAVAERASRCGSAILARCGRGSTCSARSAATCSSRRRCARRLDVRRGRGTSGRRPSDARTRELDRHALAELWEGALRWELDGAEHPPEATHLELDSDAAESRLGWRPRWDLGDGLAAAVKWHRAHLRGADMRAVSLRQIEMFASHHITESLSPGGIS